MAVWPEAMNAAQSSLGNPVAQELFLETGTRSRHYSRMQGDPPFPQELEKGPERSLLSWAGFDTARFSSDRPIEGPTSCVSIPFPTECFFKETVNERPN